MRTWTFANHANFANSTDLAILERCLAELELAFVDFQSFDAGLKGRWWNSELRRRS